MSSNSSSDELREKIRVYAFGSLVTNYDGNYEKMADDLAYSITNMVEALIAEQTRLARIDELQAFVDKVDDANEKGNVAITVGGIARVLGNRITELSQPNEKGKL